MATENSIIVATYLLFLIVSPVAFRFMKADVALVATYMAGWLILPVGVYPDGSNLVEFPYWIIGNALPSNMPIAKATVIPLGALLGSICFHSKMWRSVRWGWMDILVLTWCMWPLAAYLNPYMASYAPEPILSALQLLIIWGGAWCLGRVHLSHPAAKQNLIQGTILAVIACLPFAIFEGCLGFQTYSWVWSPHPFRVDGTERYFGFRPLGMFEDGNQYGMWVALGAFIALVWARQQFRANQGGLVSVAGEKQTDVRGFLKRNPYLVAGVAGIIALASQSAGALILAGACWFVYELAQRVRLRSLIAAVLAMLAISSVVYVSGVVPINHVGRNTVFGQHLVSAFRAVGRGSFFWRISQDQKVLPLVKQSPITGQNRWNWWKSQNTRPWGLAMLSAGQFGLLGVILMFSVWLIPALRILARFAPKTPLSSSAQSDLILSLVILAAATDALMNSFIYFPAILMAGSLVRPLMLPPEHNFPVNDRKPTE